MKLAKFSTCMLVLTAFMSSSLWSKDNNQESDNIVYQRIVSGTGNASEVLYHLGLIDKLVAVDTTSLIPAEVMAKKPKIGYRRMLSSEGILSMRPDLLILAPDAGPKAVLNQINAAGINTITIPNEKTIDGVIADIDLIAKTVGREDQAKTMLEKLQTDKEWIAKHISQYSRTPKIAFMMDSGKKKLMGLGAKTAGDYMIGVVGGDNVFADQFKSIKPVSEEAMIKSDADMVIIAAHGNEKAHSDNLVKAVEFYPNLALTKAATKKCIFRISTMKSLGFGPTFTEAAKEIVNVVPTCIDN